MPPFFLNLTKENIIMSSPHPQQSANQQDQKREELLKEVEERIAHHDTWDNTHSKIPQWLIAASMIFSFAAAVSVAIGVDQSNIIGKAVVAVLALVPGFIAAVEPKLKFEARSFYHYNYSKKLDSVRLDLQYSPVFPLNDAINRIKQIDAEMEYPTMGK